MHFDGGDSL